MGMNGVEGESLACLHLSAGLMGRERWGTPPPSAVNRLTDKCKRARPLASSRQMEASMLDWRVDGVPLAWQTEGSTLTRVKGRLVCVWVCVHEPFSNVEAWPPCTSGAIH